MRYQVTGNEMLSLPTIRETDGAVKGLTFLHMGAKGMLEIKGDRELPLLQPLLNGLPLENLVWQRQNYWIPMFTAQMGDFAVRGILLAPLGERAFFYRLQVKNTGISAAPCQIGLTGRFAETWHEINESIRIEGSMHAYDSGWNHRFVMEMRIGLPLFAFAPMAEDNIRHQYAQTGNQIDYTLAKEAVLQPGEEMTADFIWGLGYDEVAASTSAKEMLRRGFDYALSKTAAWLKAREKRIPDAHLNALMNTNMFFSFFFASGKTLDTEEFCLMTSRSPRYYVSAAYWDRDSLLWSFPAILMADAAAAREILLYVFTRQIRNVGIHSRFIDGTVLEPGFELDELCAPMIALKRYVDASGDAAFAQKECVREGVEHILCLLALQKHLEADLYETFLQPTDDVIVYPYLTYDNMLVWRMLHDIAALYGKPECTHQAENVKAAIYQHCVKNGMFIWSTDLKGHFDIYDEPPGSLMLLPYYGFCAFDDPLYQHAVATIRSAEYAYSFAGSSIAEIGCPHAPHPWVLSVCNSLLCGEKESAKQHLQKMTMDNGIACESVDENTGECATGAAFATCAGFLSFCLYEAFGGDGK